MLGVSVGTVQLWVENGMLQAWKTDGGHRRVLRDSIESLLHRGPQGRSAQAQAQAEADPDRLHILVVEDDAALQRLYLATLKRWDMAPEVTVLDNAVAALLHIGYASPDLLITDLRMPGVDGFYMLRALGQTPQLADTAVVVVTGMDAADIAQRGGVPEKVEILPKPVPFARLYERALELQMRKFAVPHARRQK